ncbi:hypothetical protein ACFXKG_32585 [Streptomyces sp. NPDC059255]
MSRVAGLGVNDVMSHCDTALLRLGDRCAVFPVYVGLVVLAHGHPGGRGR